MRARRFLCSNRKAANARKGEHISTGDFSEALAALLGKDAAGLSASAIGRLCIPVLIGATPEGREELVGFTDGARESAQDWRDLPRA
jgi:putative transposase